jgi:hypothetical protein
MYGVSVTKSESKREDGLLLVTVEVVDKRGHTDSATGVVCLTGETGKHLANAIMKAETKAKRRATLSLCGLGFLDESELDTVDDYHMVSPGGRLIIEGGSQEAADGVAQAKLAEFKEKGALPASIAEPQPTAEVEPESALGAFQKREQEQLEVERQREAKEVASKPETAKAAPPAKQPPSGTGILESFTAKEGKKGRRIKLDCNSELLFMFDDRDMPLPGKRTTKAFDMLDMAEGQKCIFDIREKTSKNGSYWEAFRIRQVGSLEWEDDGLLVIRREPAGKLFSDPPNPFKK